MRGSWILYLHTMRTIIISFGKKIAEILRRLSLEGRMNFVDSSRLWRSGTYLAAVMTRRF